MLSAIALAIGAPLTLLAGWLADRVGRRPVLLGGLALAALLYFPLYGALLSAANPALAQAYEQSPVIVHAAEGDCSLQFDPMGRRRFDARSCDIAKSYLAGAGVSYETRARATAGPAVIEIGATTLAAPDPSRLAGEELAAAIAAFQAAAKTALADAGYPAAADPAAINRPRVLGILVLLLLLAASTLGSYGALLVELFPARIRYSALSFPQHFGNGWFGGILPAVAFTIVAATGDVFAGLWYPVAIAGAVLPDRRARTARNARPRTRLNPGLFLVDLDLGAVSRVAHDREFEILHVFLRLDEHVVAVVDLDLVAVGIQGAVQAVADALGDAFLVGVLRHRDRDFGDDAADFRQPDDDHAVGGGFARDLQAPFVRGIRVSRRCRSRRERKRSGKKGDRKAAESG